VDTTIEPEVAGPVRVAGVGDLPDGWFVLFQARDQHGGLVEVGHSPEPELRELALLDVIANNADRKGGHLLNPTAGGLRGIDHGLTFHPEAKLRTVLWGWAGQVLLPGERERLGFLATELQTGGALHDRLGAHLTAAELAATRARVEQLLVDGVLPGPTRGRYPPVPWPLF
jgi:uncharacterized repeat protein (TIGR03843 family)